VERVVGQEILQAVAVAVAEILELGYSLLPPELLVEAEQEILVSQVVML
jgi:hypothetical protein